jgi:hypothetical protein
MDRETARRPVVGSLWVWEPEKPHAVALIKVTAVRWNGEEWFVGTEALAENAGEVMGTSNIGHGVIWNDLSHFWEACHYVAASPGPPRARGAVRRGEPQEGEITDEP